MRILEMGQLGDLSPEGTIAIGVLVGLISTSLQAIGLTLQRKSHILEDEKHPFDVRRPPYKRRRWQLGMFMFVLSNIVGSTIQLTTLPLPVLSTLQASGLVFNTLFATLILGEAFTRYSLVGTVLVCIGAVMIGIFGAIGEPPHTLDQLLLLLGRPAFLKWMAGTAVIVAVTLAGARVLKLLSTPSRARSWALRHHLAPAMSLHNPRLKALRGALFGSASGILSAHSLLIAKSAVELLVRTIIDRVNQFNRWQSWVILLALVVFALSQLYFMHRGLKLCSTSILYPFVFCIYNIIAILDGLIYFRQVSRLTALHAGLVAVGTVILLSGVLCLSWRLEELAGHPTGQAVGPPPAPLTPGLGLLEEQHVRSASHPNILYEDDEESQLAAERQPLLPYTPRDTPSSSRRYTLPRLTSIRRSSTATTSSEAAEIWAELEDDDDEADLLDTDHIPPPSPSSLLHHRLHSKRPPARGWSISTPSSASKAARTKSAAPYDVGEHSPLNPNGQQQQQRKGGKSPATTTSPEDRGIRTTPRITRRGVPLFSRVRSPRESLSASTPLLHDTERVSRDPNSVARADVDDATDDAESSTYTTAQHSGPINRASDAWRWVSGWVTRRGRQGG